MKRSMNQDFAHVNQPESAGFFGLRWSEADAIVADRQTIPPIRQTLQ
jgi:hypothetical protein